MDKLNPMRFLLTIVLLLQPLFSFALQLHAGVQLNENSFDQLTKSGLWFIENFSPFCPHCKKFAPTWVEVVENMSPYESQGLKLGQIDCIAQGDLCIKLNVDFYPQMKLYEDGTYIEHYTGEKTVEAIKSYLEPKLQAYAAKHKPKDIFESEPAVLEPEVSKSTIEELAAESPLVSEGGHSSSSHHQNPNDPMNLENAPNKDGKVMTLHFDNWSQYTHLSLSGHPILIHYHTAWCKECRKLTPTLTEVAAQLKHQVNVAEFDCDMKLNKELCAREGLKTFPGLILYHDGTKLSFSEEKTTNTLVTFARTVVQNRGTHEINLQELERAIRTIPIFFLFLHSSHTPLSTINAVQSVGKAFSGSALILKSDHANVFERLSMNQEHATILVFKEFDPTPWAKIAVRDSDGRDGTSASERSLTLAVAIRHWMAINSVPLMDQLSNTNFYRVLTSGAKKLVVLACLSGMVTDDYGQLDAAKSNPKSIQLKEDMKIWAHQWRKSQEARGVDDMMIDWVWVNAEKWSEWLYNAYGVNLPPPKDDPKESSALIVIDAHNHKYYDTQANGLEIQFKPTSVFQVLLAVEMDKIKGKLSGTQWGRIKWRFAQFKHSVGFLFHPSWLIFWFTLAGIVWFSIKSLKSYGFISKSNFPTQSLKNGLYSSGVSSDLPDTANHCKPGFGQVFGLGSNLPSFKAD